MHLINQHIGSRIRSYRKARGLTLPQLAERNAESKNLFAALGCARRSKQRSFDSRRSLRMTGCCTIPSTK